MLWFFLICFGLLAVAAFITGTDSYKVFKVTGRWGKMSREECDFADEAYKLHIKGLDATKAKKAKEILDQYETAYEIAPGRSKFRSNHIYLEDISDIRENYEGLEIDEWREKAAKVLDELYELLYIVEHPDFKDVERAYRAKKRCLDLWHKYFEIPRDPSINYGAKEYMRNYFGEGYKSYLDDSSSLEKHLTDCVEKMKPEYKRKTGLDKKIMNIVAEKESIMRSELLSMPFDGFTRKEVEYCYNELVRKYRLVAIKIGSRYFVSLSDKEKEKRNKDT